jgi:hypothetical protein
MAFGMGFGMAQRTNVIAAAVPQSEIGVASSVLALARNVAGAFGVAVFGTLLTTSTESNVLSITRLSSFNGTTSDQYKEFISLITLKAQIDAYQNVFLASALLVFVGAWMALFIGDVKMQKDVKVHVEA